jgi:hypothetical protein
MQVESGNRSLVESGVLCGPKLATCQHRIVDETNLVVHVHADLPHAKQAALRRAIGILRISSVQMQSPRSLSQVSITAEAGANVLVVVKVGVVSVFQRREGSFERGCGERCEGWIRDGKIDADEWR